MSADGPDTTRARSTPTDGEDIKVVLEQTLLTCPEVFVYRIPPMMTSGGHRAEDWNLAKPLETCSLVVMRRDDACLLRLLSEKPKKDGPPGATEPHLFCTCQIRLDFGDPTKKLEHWVEAVVDSSRYSVIRISDERTGREAHVGMGFRERSDAVSFKMSLQEYENALRRERKAEAMYERSHPDGGERSDGGTGIGDGGDGAGGSGAPPGGDSLTPPSSAGGPSTLPAVGKLTLKEGEKIHVNLKGKDKDHGSGGGSGGLRKSTALGLSGRKAPPTGTGALVGKGGLLLKKPPSDRQVVPASPPTQEGDTTKAAAGASATSTTNSSSSGTNTPKSSDEPPMPTVHACTHTTEAGGGGGSEGNGNSDSEEDDFGDFEEAGS